MPAELSTSSFNDKFTLLKTEADLTNQTVEQAKVMTKGEMAIAINVNEKDLPDWMFSTLKYKLAKGIPLFKRQERRNQLEVMIDVIKFREVFPAAVIESRVSNEYPTVTIHFDGKRPMPILEDK